MNKHIREPKKKYRPVLTAEQILHILLLAKLENPISAGSMSLISSLAPFQAKIESAGISPAYTTTPRKPAVTLEMLGEAADEVQLGVDIQADLAKAAPETEPNRYMSKEQIWAASYAKYSLDPVSCTLVEIQQAKEHMYLEGLMSIDEVAEHEAPLIEEAQKLTKREAG